ncbi:hypothetical protein SCAR479_07263 [Seiridium cardinale]|uniref:Uncharacterized protein n=1 Tax=Seiridium cardinale TaxID=138064 RepID=A0ABR2XQF8_9PEZI
MDETHRGRLARELANSWITLFQPNSPSGQQPRSVSQELTPDQAKALRANKDYSDRHAAFQFLTAHHPDGPDWWEVNQIPHGIASSSQALVLPSINTSVTGSDTRQQSSTPVSETKTIRGLYGSWLTDLSTLTSLENPKSEQDTAQSSPKSNENGLRSNTPELNHDDRLVTNENTEVSRKTAALSGLRKKLAFGRKEEK